MKKLSIAQITGLSTEDLLKYYQKAIKNDWIKCPLCQSTDLEVFGIDKNYNNGIMLNCKNKHDFAVQRIHKALEYMMETHIKE